MPASDRSIECWWSTTEAPITLRTSLVRTVRRCCGESPATSQVAPQRRQAAIRHSRTLNWDAMVMIDADSVVSPGFFDECEQAMSGGALALQARSEAAAGHRLVDQAALASFAIQGVTLPRGREVMGLPVRLAAPAWCCAATCWNGSTSGQKHPRTCRSRSTSCKKVCARATSSVPGCGRPTPTRGELLRNRSNDTKRGGWLRRRSSFPSCCDVADGRDSRPRGFLVSPPFASAAALLVVGTCLALVARSAVATWVGVGALAALLFAFFVGAVQARVGWRVVAALAAAPFFVCWKVLIQLKAILGLRGGLREFGPTDRQSTPSSHDGDH